ncbi:uncharacterized protein F5147DRAFT_650234 [Suillus discolor]|uniref:Uncharacterized protein n=1 Tax=Suillus discolor TaxID=1912936 RepID=A0A9P7FDV3_9AGAM|nr:uncharacterized protein F5147DRAFT_650234 [Suillus discolor]KAG2113824.1 hypothetical protein F5147DRAFT_650234 [Suillus discolor]
MKQPLQWINLTSLDLKTSKFKFLHFLQRRRNGADLESNKLLCWLAVPTSEPAGQDLRAAPAPASEAIVNEPQRPKITYFLAMFPEDQLRKPEKQQKAINTFLCLSSDQEFDTLKAQILQKISEKLKPKTLAYENYSVEWYISRLQTAPLALSSADDYKFLLEHALKQEALTANIVIQALPTAKKLKHRRDHNESGDENQSNDGGSENSSSEDDKPKKKSKKDKKSKSVVKTILNEKITSKIVQLQNRWLCSKAGCSSNHCFIHPEHPDHFLLGHKQLLVWASAWNKDNELADLETPPNHLKFNFIPGQKSEVSPLLQHRLAERNQPMTGHASSPIINFNIPPDLLALWHPPGEICDVQNVNNAPAAAITSDQASLMPVGAQLGPDLSLNDFCAQYSLSDDIQSKLHKNGYMGTDVETTTLLGGKKRCGKCGKVWTRYREVKERGLESEGKGILQGGGIQYEGSVVSEAWEHASDAADARESADKQMRKVREKWVWFQTEVTCWTNDGQCPLAAQGGSKCHTETLSFIIVAELKDMGFKFREVAVMKAAV